MKSHFLYTRQQRNGIFLLLLLIGLTQGIHHFVDFPAEKLMMDDQEIAIFQNQIDSLRRISLKKSERKIYPFNPNFISDYKGYQLGMSIAEIDRLHSFRKQNKYVNSAKEFQQVTQVSDSLLQKMKPYFKFPSWTRKRKKSKPKMTFDHRVDKDASLISTTDLNLATFSDLLVVDGVDDALSERIIKYREKLQGFFFADQIYEVWGMKKEVGDRILERFSIVAIPKVEKLNINTATFKQVLKNPYIDYDLCVKIFDYRDEVAELQNISELKNIDDFPLKIYDRIVVYLLAE